MTYHSKKQKEKIKDVISVLVGKPKNPYMSMQSVREIMEQYCAKPSLISHDNIEDFKDQYKSNVDYLLCGLWEAYKYQDEQIDVLKKTIEENKETQKKLNHKIKILRDRARYYAQRESDNIQEQTEEL